MSILGMIPLTIGLVIGSCTLLLLGWDWRWQLVGLAGVYLAMTLMVSENWPMELALVKLIVGWMATTILATALLGRRGKEEVEMITGRLLRLCIGLLIALTLFSLAPSVRSWLPEGSPETIIGGLLLIGLGLLQTSMTVRPLPLIVGLLTVLSGFEVLYALVERSLLVIGLLAALNLSLALVGAYLIQNEQEAQA
jgi:hypothetical protein